MVIRRHAVSIRPLDRQSPRARVTVARDAPTRLAISCCVDGEHGAHLPAGGLRRWVRGDLDHRASQAGPTSGPAWRPDAVVVRSSAQKTMSSSLLSCSGMMSDRRVRPEASAHMRISRPAVYSSSPPSSADPDRLPLPGARARLVYGQGQVAEFGAKVGGAVQVPAGGSGGAGEQFQGLGWVKDVQAHQGSRVGPGGGEVTGDQ
jgi:hypothetical protein